MFLHEVSGHHCGDLLPLHAPLTARCTQLTLLLLKHSTNLYFAGTDLTENPVNGPDLGRHSG
jgi:hypothetical protein